MTFPRSVYSYNTPVDVADFDVILDPVQVW